MEKNREIKLIVLVAVFVLVLLGAYALYENLSGDYAMNNLAPAPTAPPTTPAVIDETAAAETQPANAAPDFTVYDIDGNPVKLSDFRGKPVILNFWASWCGPCVMEFPEFQSAYDTYGEDIHFVLVNLTDGSQETVDSASQFVADNGYTLPIYYDTDMDAAYAYGVSAVPVSYFLDADGNFVAWAQGSLSADMLEQGISMLQE